MDDKIKKLIIDYVDNYMENSEIITEWKKPLVAYADASDPLFKKLKEVANPTHFTPDDILPGAKTVVTYFLPFVEDIPYSNVDGRYSSREWAEAYIETNTLIGKLNDYLIETIEKMGYRAAKLNPELNMDYEKLSSVWSNRHVAYIAGLGTFGLNNMLITKKGCCGRLGNIVTDIEVVPTERPKKEYCLYKDRESCKDCLENCVNKALKEDGFDRFKCYEMLQENYAVGGIAEVCGKCLTVVPCSFINPVL